MTEQIAQETGEMFTSVDQALAVEWASATFEAGAEVLGPTVEDERDALKAACLELLGRFSEKGHPGRPCLRTPWVPVEHIAQMREMIASVGGGDHD